MTESFLPGPFRPHFWRCWPILAWDGWRGDCSRDERPKIDCLRLVLAALVSLLPSCSPSHADRIVVGSKNFTESYLLGEIIAQKIEAQQVESHTN